MTQWIVVSSQERLEFGSHAPHYFCLQGKDTKGIGIGDHGIWDNRLVPCNGFFE